MNEEDEDEDSFFNPIPSAVPIEPTPKPPALVKKEEEEDAESDDSFDNFKPAPIPTKKTPPTLQRTDQTPTQKPKISLQSQRISNKNGSFSRHGSDNSFFKGPIKTSTTSPSIPMSQLSVLDRPITPNGELLMLRSQLEKEKREKERMNMEWQRKMKEMTDKCDKAMEDKCKQINQLRKENEVLTISSACRVRQSDASPQAANSSPISVPKRFPKFSKSILKRPDEPRQVLTPRRTVQIAAAQPLSAFRHENIAPEEDTFQLEESFQPAATSTPRAPPVTRNLRRNHQNDSNEPPPPIKRKFVATRKSRSRAELAKIREEYRAQLAESSPEVAETLEEDAEFLRKQLELMRIAKEEHLTKSRIRQFCANFQKPPPPAKCEICRILEPRAEKCAESGKKMKEWEIRETKRIEEKQRDSKIPQFLKYNTIIQNVARKGLDELRRSKFAPLQKVEGDFEIRKLEEIREEKRDSWRTKMKSELDEKGEMSANLNAEEKEDDEYIWTSSASESADDESLRICEPCGRHAKTRRRRGKCREQRLRIARECFDEYGKNQREEMRNRSILTKSKIEAADKELNREMNELFGAGDIEMTDDF
ncbi:unnamed protein product [Caenorhabditis angaria]|uniref:Uncharacterized protein n=1 Tax=Caenorhabditis angaria TaxID=860376 RepID=A0A9P1IM87_9PELO|nr:unnamed protein product [Caenorhabditis angaria]